MGIGDWFRKIGQELDKAGEEAREARDRIPAPTRAPRRASSVAADRQSSNTLPMNLHALVQSHRADIAAGILRTLLEGNEEAIVGLGRTVDVPLLPADLLAADVSLTERDLAVVAVRWTEKGWMLVRDVSNFGVFWAPKDAPGHWSSIKRRSAVDGLEPGDWLGLGSCPGDAVKCRLPLPPSGVSYAPPPGKLETWALDARLHIAVQHWRYAEITLSRDEDAVVVLPERLAGIRLSLERDLDRPSSGWVLHVENAGAGVDHGGPMEPLHAMAAGSTIRLKGPGHGLRLGGTTRLSIPPCVAPTPRFDRTHPPDRQDIREVLDLGPHDMDDPHAVRRAWKDAARRLHPDRHGNQPGPTSRFVEAKACWEAFQRL